MKNFIKDIIISLFGCIIAAFGTSCILLPNQLSSGGFSGIATILYYFLGWQMGTTIILMNIPLFIISYFKVGKEFFFKSLISTFAFSKFIDIFEQFKLIENDKFLASIYGGVLVGIGLAIVFKGESSTGGSDLIGQLARAYNRNLKISKIMLILDVVIVLLNIVFFNQLVIGLYSFVAIYIIEKMLDIIFEGVNFCKAIYIISDESENISKAIIAEMDKGVTGFYGKGIYKNSDKLILMCVTKRRNISKLKETVRKIDKYAFIIIVDAREVYGLGFKK
ncbi:MAG: YitT family protein [Clostridia bacterium]|nr:YitT family protein [Clostridia bacterium]